MSNHNHADVVFIDGGLAGLSAGAGAKRVVFLDTCEAGKSGVSAQAKT